MPFLDWSLSEMVWLLQFFFPLLMAGSRRLGYYENGVNTKWKELGLLILKGKNVIH
jgi:hypothetical protein